MKRILFPVLLIAASALIMGIGAVACGDDDDDDDDGGAATGNGGTTLGAYLREVNEVQEGVTQATDAIGEQAAETWSDPARARQSLSAAIDVADSAVTSLQDLDPPEEASAAHAELIAAGENLSAVAKDVSDQLAGMQPGSAFDTFAEEAQAPDSDLSEAINRMVQACESMEQVSEDAKAGVDLDCPKPIS